MRVGNSTGMGIFMQAVADLTGASNWAMQSRSAKLSQRFPFFAVVALWARLLAQPMHHVGISRARGSSPRVPCAFSSQ